MPLNPNVVAIHELPLQCRTGIFAEIFQKAKLLPSLKLEKIFDYAEKRYCSQYYQDIPEPVIFTMMPSGIDNNSDDTYTKPENQ